MKRIFAAALLLALTGCITPAPRNIKPAAVDPAPYRVMSEAQLAAEQDRAAREMYKTWEEQHWQHYNDLDDWPFQRPQNPELAARLAKQKGELKAIADVAKEKGWTLPPLPKQPAIFKPAAEKTGMR